MDNSESSDTYADANSNSDTDTDADFRNRRQ